MASTDKCIMYPEGRCNLLQLGFDKTTKTIEQLVTGNYVRDYSTVIEYVDSNDDPAFHASIASKFGDYFSNKGYTMVLYKSVKVYQFIFIGINGDATFAVSYHTEDKWTGIVPLAGYENCDLSNPNNYVPIALKRSGHVKYLRIGGYLTKAMTNGGEYALAIIPERQSRWFLPNNQSFHQNCILTSSGAIASISIQSDRKIMFMPRQNLPAETGINVNLCYI